MKFSFLFLILGLVILSGVAILNQNPFVFDERLFPPNVELMEKYGFGEKFLLEMKDQAPGPLYEFVHLPLKKLTHLNPRGLRIVNLILFYLTIIMLALTYNRTQKQSLTNSFHFSFHIIAIPILWQVAGLALTEIPAMFFVSISFYFGAVLLTESSKFSTLKIIGLSVLMGITGGLAVLGRTPYLMIIPCFFCVLLAQKYILNQKVHITKSFIPYVIITLSMIIPIFFIWGGLVPPLQPRVDGAIEPWHGLLAMAYAGLIALVINPKWFIFNKTILIILIVTFFCFIIIKLLGFDYGYAPLSYVIEKVFGYTFLVIYAEIVSPLLATFGVYFLISCYYRGKEKLNNPVYLFALLSVLAILASSAKISHQFSSRYVAQAAPFMVIVLAELDETDKWKWIRILIGIAIGFLSLNTYANMI